eukprot:15451092-Alexandrium_andersonii.AAC.1
MGGAPSAVCVTPLFARSPNVDDWVGFPGRVCDPWTKVTTAYAIPGRLQTKNAVSGARWRSR